MTCVTLSQLSCRICITALAFGQFHYNKFVSATISSSADVREMALKVRQTNPRKWKSIFWLALPDSDNSKTNMHDFYNITKHSMWSTCIMHIRKIISIVSQPQPLSPRCLALSKSQCRQNACARMHFHFRRGNVVEMEFLIKYYYSLFQYVLDIFWISCRSARDRLHFIM